MQILKLQHLSANRRRGFTSAELMIAATIFLSLLGIAFKFTTSSLMVEGRESQKVDLQQNLRSAMQLISQDIRSSSGLHVLNKANCQTAEPCSNNEQISIISAQGAMTLVAETASTAYSNSQTTRVCDARNFAVGDTALILNVSDIKGNVASYDYLDISGVNIRANHNAACTRANSDLITHNAVSGNWTNNSYISQAIVATYYLAENPFQQGKTALFRKTGIGTQGPQTGIVAFNITNLSIGYGVRVGAGLNSIATLTFYPDLVATKAAKGSDYSTIPDEPGKIYVGDQILAIRVTLDGESAKDLAVTNASTENGAIERAPAHFSLSQTIQLRRGSSE